MHTRYGPYGMYGFVHNDSMFTESVQIKEFSEDYDYVIVFPLHGENHERQSKISKHAFHEMLNAGLKVFPYRSVQNDELLLLIRCPEPELKKFAEKIDYRLRLDKNHLQEVLKQGDPAHRIAGIEISDDKTITSFTPYEFIYLKYGRQIDQNLYAKSYSTNDPFPKSVRLKLTYLLLRAPTRDGGCNLEISHLLHHQKILAIYPLHNREISKAIMHKIWELRIWPWDVPFEDIREYYGEKIALYNVFIAHYSWWIWTPAIIGLVFQLVVWGTLNFSHPVLPFYSLVVTIWSIVMLEYWKRTQATVALEWGMSDFERSEQERPEFAGKIIKSFINGKDMTYYPPTQAKKLAALSRSVVASFLAIVCGVVAGIYVLRIYLQSRSDTQEVASLVASVINTVQIQIFNLIYQSIAVYLTDLENHRTDTQYEDRLIVKLFVFQFVNSYASFFYLAFIASNLPRPSNAPTSYLGECGYSTCMEPLSINLAIIFGSRLTLGNFLDIFIPYLIHKKKIKDETAGIAPDKRVTPAERDYMLLNYDTVIASIQDYADTAVQYGFGLLFITALPCASLCSLFSSYWKVKFNAWKLGTFYQRPVPQGAQDIGTWLTIFQVISVAAVITNAGLVCFTMNVLWQYSLQGRVWIFIGFQWVLFSLQFFFERAIADTPEEVEIQLRRMEFIKQKVIEHVPDEDYGENLVDDDEDYGEDDPDVDSSLVPRPQGKKQNDVSYATCCQFVTIDQKRTKVHRIEKDFPVRTYPFDEIHDVWPKPIVKSDPEIQGLLHHSTKVTTPTTHVTLESVEIDDSFPSGKENFTNSPGPAVTESRL